jgi:UDP-glucose 4-epimerase
MDLAEAHALAIEHVVENDVALTVNLGTGIGISVLEMVSAFETATGRKIPLNFAPRRPGDVASYFAKPTLAAQIFGWKAERDVNDMCRDAWRWEAKRIGINDV